MKTAKTAKCNWCSKVVPVTKKGGLAPHLNPGGLRCIGTAQVPFDTTPRKP